MSAKNFFKHIFLRSEDFRASLKETTSKRIFTREHGIPKEIHTSLYREYSQDYMFENPENNNKAIQLVESMDNAVQTEDKKDKKKGHEESQRNGRYLDDETHKKRLEQSASSSVTVEADVEEADFQPAFSVDEEEDTSSDDYYTGFRKVRIEKPMDYETICAGFLDTITFAKEFVEDIIQESEARIKLSYPRTSGETADSSRFSGHHEESTCSMDRYYGFKMADSRMKRVDWPLIGEFNVEYGAVKIDEYLSMFSMTEDWMYVIYYQGLIESHCSDLYRYQVIYSLPTWRYPIAQATASVYFMVEVCKVKPAYCPVDVTFQYETFRKVHKPGVSNFNEKWLNIILDSKIKFFKTLTF